LICYGPGMSCIDTFDHQFVGYFGNLPIYRPLVVHTGAQAGGDEFSCAPGNLIIGGGGGEHPAVVVRSPAYAVCRFLFQWLLWCEEDHTQAYLENSNTFERWHHVLLRGIPLQPWSEVFEFAGWGLADFEAFAKRCRSEAFMTPFPLGVQGSNEVEEWFAASLGEFVFFAMPELAGQTIGLFDDAVRLVRRSVYRNVVLPAPGYPDYFGRTSSADGVIWGNMAWVISRSK
jgi:hypothetical protein